MKTVINNKTLSPTKKLEKDILENGKVWSVIQERPYTAVGMSYIYDGESFTGVGFSKVNWPDEWNPEYGYDSAVTRAVRSIRKQVQQYKTVLHTERIKALPLSA